MKKNILVILYLLACYVVNAQNSYADFTDSITLKHMESLVYTLASEQMEGRETGSKGQKKAAEFISNYFRENGLDSLNYYNYYQNYNLVSVNYGQADLFVPYQSEENPNRSQVNLYAGAYANAEFKNNDTLPLFYAGLSHNFDGINLKNHVVIVLIDENIDKTYANIQTINQQSGAQLFFILFKENGKYMRSKYPTTENIDGVYDATNMINMAQEGSLPIRFGKHQKNFEQITDGIYKQDELCVFYGYPFNSDRLFGIKSKTLFKEEKKRIKNNGIETTALKIDSVFCSIDTKKAEIDTMVTENIIAYIPGTTISEEVIIVSAHYDHIGKRNDTLINYGADDNASGTAAIMEIAKTMQLAYSNGHRTKRSVVFVAYSGEEIGLKGSDYFVNNCPFNLDSVILNINLDMIGRNKNDKDKYNQTGFVIANGKHSNFVKKTARKASKEGDELKLSKHPGLKERMTWSVSSDHFRFKRAGIPIACFFTGLHADYHTPRDTPDKINYPKLTELTKTGYLTIWELANTDKNLTSNRKPAKKEGFIEKMMD